MKDCSVTNCDRRFYAKKMCKLHYDRAYWSKTIALDGPINEKVQRPKGTPCKVTGCQGKLKGKGYCRFHYERFLYGLELNAPCRGYRLQEDGTKYCRSCGETKIADMFYKNQQSADGLSASCKYCKTYKNRKGRGKDLHRKYGITLEQYDDLLAKQQGTCAICKDGRDLVVDHNHITKKVRGILCRRCNSALGFLRDSPELAQMAITYITADGLGDGVIYTGDFIP